MHLEVLTFLRAVSDVGVFILNLIKFMHEISVTVCGLSIIFVRNRKTFFVVVPKIIINHHDAFVSGFENHMAISGWASELPDLLAQAVGAGNVGGTTLVYNRFTPPPNSFEQVQNPTETP